MRGERQGRSLEESRLCKGLEGGRVEGDWERRGCRRERRGVGFRRGEREG